MSRSLRVPLLALLCAIPGSRGEEEPIPQAWDYSSAMKEATGRGNGRTGVVLHVGDSITYAAPYSQWARSGAGKTDEDKAALAWMHSGADDETDGWWLARADHPDGGRSYTASGGMRADQILGGGPNKLPPLAEILDKYRPEMVVLMLGTNDVTARRDPAEFRADMEKVVDLILGRGVIVILSTIPPHPRSPELSRADNEALRSIARSRKLPLIDYEREILKRRPDDWNGTLMAKDDAHPSVNQGGVTPTSAPTAENLSRSGYLLRGWLSVRKIAEVKRTVLDVPAPARRASTPRPNEPLRLPVTRDTWFANVDNEADGNNGGAARLKLKSYQEMSLVDIDPKALRGHLVRSATLHVRSASEPRPLRVTVGTFGADWVEGTASGYTPEPGSSTFNHRKHPDVPWAYPGSDLCAVILGQGGTAWRMADASTADDQGWQSIAVDPLVVAARVAGISRGFLLFDDTGSEWTRRGESFTISHMPNRFLYSKDSNSASAPYLTVALGPPDESPPAAPDDLRSDPADLPAGEAWLRWKTPRDVGPAGTVGFFVRVDGKDVPRYLIPLASKAGDSVRMHLRDLDLKPGATVQLTVRAVDGAGNLGPEGLASVQVSGKTAPPLPESEAEPFHGHGPLPRLGAAEVAIVDELDKVQPVTGAMIPPEPDGYLAANHLWDAGSKRVRMYAARNEFVGFQILVRGDLRDARPTLTFEGAGASGIQVDFGRYHPIATSQGPLPDPIVPLGSPSAEEAIAGRKSRSLHCELYVPHDARAGEHQGKLILAAGGKTLVLDVSLHVWDFTLPDFLSFVPEMNCYDLPANDRDYYRLAHRHRTVLNRVPYPQNGMPTEGSAPRWDGRTLDWSAWDKRFGPYFDGSAFADLPRRGVPLESFYLPMNENWPDPIEGNYNGDYWADQAFSARYRRDFVEVARQFAAHANEKHWDETLFQFFLNGKNNYKEGGWSRASSPWLLDEPANFQDFWALRFFGTAFHEGVQRAPGKAKLVFRADISRPEWQRDALDGLLDYDVVGGAMRPYHRIVFDRKTAQGSLAIEYGSANPIEGANVQPVAWCLDSWSLGSDGVLPWQTVGTENAWKQADPTSLFYPGRGGVEAGPFPSIRLKAFRRGQQDVEYLTILSQLTHEPRWAIGLRVREALHLSGQRKGTGLGGPEDAGLIQFDRLTPQSLWALRVRVGRALSESRPAPRRRLVEFRTPTRDPSRLAPGLVAMPGAGAGAGATPSGKP